MKMLERSNRYMEMFNIVAPMQEALTQIKAMENEIDVLRSAGGSELEANADLIAFYADKVDALVVDVEALTNDLGSWIYRANQTVSRISKVDGLDNLGDTIPVDNGLEGLALTDEEVDELMAGLVEDEHESN